MPVNDKDIQSQAPVIFDLVKEARFSLVKNNLDPNSYKAAVITTVDHSHSTLARGLYGSREQRPGIIPQTVDIAFAAGLLFDDDGKIPVSLFDDKVIKLGNMDLGNCHRFMDQHTRYPFGGTKYLSALEWIVEMAGYSDVKLTGMGKHRSSGVSVLSEPLEHGRHWWGGKRKINVQSGIASNAMQPTSSSNLRVLAQAQYPTFAIFITDGEPMDYKDDIRKYLTLISQLPIFVQFIGVGDCDFTFLRELDEDLPARLIDNANFFDAKEVGHNQHMMLDKMLGEFPDYYRKAIDLGLIVSSI